MKLPRNFIKFIILFSLTLLTFSAQAALTKWVDEQGKVHYSDTPPASGKTHAVPHVSSSAAQSAAPATYSTKTYAEREVELKKARQEKIEAADKKAKQDANTEIKQKNCAIAQQNLRVLEEGTRIVTYDANGERTYLDDAAREQRLSDARNSISSNCN